MVSESGLAPNEPRSDWPEREENAEAATDTHVTEFNEQRQKAFDYVQEAAKQIITLSTGVLALTITFAQDLERVDTWEWVLSCSWALYVVSIVAGVWLLLALCGTLEPQRRAVPVSTRGPNVAIPALVQILTFLVATVGIGIYAIAAPRNAAAATETEKLLAQLKGFEKQLARESLAWQTRSATHSQADAARLDAIAVGEAVHVLLEIARITNGVDSAELTQNFWKLYPRLTLVMNQDQRAVVYEIKDVIKDFGDSESDVPGSKDKVRSLAMRLAAATPP